MTIRRLAVAAALLVAATALATPVEADHPSDRVVVCPTGHGVACDRTSIQSAVDHADPGDHVVVRPGVYREAVTVPAAKAGLTLCATGPAGVLCNPDAAGATVDATGSATTVLDVEAPQVTVQDLTLTWDGDLQRVVHGVFVEDSADGFRLEDATVRLPGTKVDAQDPHPSVGSFFDKPESRGLEAPGASVAVVGSTFVAESPDPHTLGALGGHGINVRGGDDVIRGNRIVGWTFGVMLRGPDTTIAGNAFAGNLRAIQVTPGAGGAGGDTATTIRDNTFEANGAGVFFANGDGQSITLRDNHLGLSNAAALHFNGGASGIQVDARENYWGVATCAAIHGRIVDLQGDNDVRVAPYEGPTGLLVGPDGAANPAASDPTC